MTTHKPTQPSIPYTTPLTQALQAARANVVPGIILWIFAAALTLGYYHTPMLHAFFERVAELKTRFGFLYSIPATALFGGLIPFIYLKLNPKTAHETPGNWIFFYVFYWAYKGFEVDLLYRIQGMLFGTTATVATVACKVAIDQFVYNPLWTVPLMSIAFLWKDMNFSFARTGARIASGHIQQSYWPILLSTWIVWIPAVAIIYSLPSPLQIPLFNIVLCFFVLLLSTLTKKK